MGEVLDGLRVKGISFTMEAAGFTCYLFTVVRVLFERYVLCESIMS